MVSGKFLSKNDKCKPKHPPPKANQKTTPEKSLNTSNYLELDNFPAVVCFYQLTKS